MGVPLLLGIDVGTSSTKAIAIDDRGRTVASASSAHPISQPRPGWSEQDPEDWWASTVRAVRDVLTRVGSSPRITGVGLSGQMHGSVFLDRQARHAGEDGAKIQALRPALLWNDQRTAAQCAAIEAAMGDGVAGRTRLVERVGNAMLTGFTLPKVVWLRDEEPATFARVASGGGVCMPKDFVRMKLVGPTDGWACDVGDASGWPGLDVRTREVASDVFRAIGLDPAIFPVVRESAALGGRVTAWAARETGLPAGIPVAVGSGDNQCGAIGAGVVEPGQMLLTLGTSGVVYSACAHARPDLSDPMQPGRLQVLADGTGSDRAAGAWCQTGCMLSAAGALSWAMDVVAPGEPLDKVLGEAARAPAGSGGLVFLPYLTGERCPHQDPEARGAWVGLTSRHGRGHLVRSVLEGVAMSMAQIVEMMEAGAGRGGTSSVRVVGGGAKSPLWLQILADATGHELRLPAAEEGSALGAAVLGGVAAGVWASVREACRAIHTDRVAAVPREGGIPKGTRAAFDGLYAALRGANEKLGGVDRGTE